MEILQNLDLLSVGIAVAAIGLLGFVVFFSDRRSITNQTFLAFSLITSLWGVINYFDYVVASEEISLWLTRGVLFFAVWQAFFLFQLFYTFPNTKVSFSIAYKFLLVPLVVLTSLLTLSPLVFSSVTGFSESGVPLTEKGPGIIIFGLVAVGLVIGGLVNFALKTKKSSGIEKVQFRLVLAGALVMFLCIVALNFILPAFHNNFRFIPLGAVFILPFVIFTSYAIFKHHLLNIKVITTEVLTFILAIVSFVEVVIADNPTVLIFRSVVLALILAFGVLLIKSVRQEVELREKAEQLTKELAAANTKLEDLSRFKTQLLSLASHQIKSPMAAIKGFISIMLQGLYGPIEPKVRETLEKMKRSSDELIDLINSVLDLRKVEEGRMEYAFERVSLTAMTKGVIEEIQPLAMAKGLKLESVLPEKEIFVQADKTKLKQVVQNLIDNSIKYTPTPSADSGQVGFVRVELKEESATRGTNIIFSVKDSGLGMSAELLPHLFGEFVRDERVKKEIRGTGFGLYIAKSIIEAHGGTIWAESPGEGRGSTFFVRLKTTN